MPELDPGNRGADTRAFAFVLAVAAAAVVLAACGGGSKHHTTTATTTTKPAATTTSTATQAAVKTVVPPVAYWADTVNRPGVEEMRLSIYDLRRTGPFVTLDFSVACVAPGDQCDYANDLDGYDSDTSTSPDGVALVDPVNNKEYLPVEDSQQRTYGSTLPGIVIGTAPKVALAWVKFAAPPASVTSIDVAFPDGGPQISDVPISDSATPPTAAQIGTGTYPANPAPFAIGPDSTSTAGLNMRVANLVLKVGNPAGSDQENGTQSTITLSSDVLFHFDKSNLTSAAKGVIAQVGARIKARAKGVVKIVGYTDSIGSDAVNFPLSQRRAASVVKALKPLVAGAPVTFTATGLGPQDPVAPNTKPDGADNPAGRRLNRRVTITFTATAPAPPSAPQTSSSSASSTPSTSGSRSVVYHAGTSSLQVTADALYRVGDLAVLRFTAKCLSSSCSGIQEFAGDETVVPPLSSQQTGSLTNTSPNKIAGLYLRDPSTGNVYLAAYNPNNDTDQNPVTASVGSSTVTLPLWVYFPAPPSNVTALDVVMPGGNGTIHGVPISSKP